MFFAILTLLSALSIAGVSAWFSIAGFMAIFSASAIPVAIMAGTLEVGKLVTASWLYRNWESSSRFLKIYLSIAIMVLIFITSIGIFGFLSKAHIEQKAVIGNNQLKIESIERRIERERNRILDAETVIQQLDEAVSILQDYDRIRGPQGSLAVRESQKDERQKLNDVIDRSTDNILSMQEDLAPLRKSQLETELKVGPIKYVAELIYGNSTEVDLERAVRFFILILIFVFDPLAITLVVAANKSLIDASNTDNMIMDDNFSKKKKRVMI